MSYRYTADVMQSGGHRGGVVQIRRLDSWDCPHESAVIVTSRDLLLARAGSNGTATLEPPAAASRLKAEEPRPARRYGETPHPDTGRLFVVEGIDGAGKSTQLTLLAQWLRSLGHAVVFTEWNSSAVIKATTSRGERRRLLTPLTYSLIHATDFSDRVEREIIPALKAGAIVLANRYVFTALARDVVRGVSPSWVRSLYRFAAVPARAFYFRLPLETALHRILSERPKLKWYEAGMDLGLRSDPHESYRVFQSRILAEYERLVEEFGLLVMDATRPAEVQQRLLREAIRPHLPAPGSEAVARERA
jgi:dTMP kinase